jgi:hypothetical protein
VARAARRVATMATADRTLEAALAYACRRKLVSGDLRGNLVDELVLSQHLAPVVQ